MFLLRSAFWLFVAFMVIRPGIDISATASSLSTSAMANGQKFIAQQITQAECANIECVGGKAALVAVLPKFPPAGSPMHMLPALEDTVPLPRPRPHRAG